MTDCIALCRYLSPEPLLQDPKWVSEELQSGHQVPAYSYARNNPIRYVDPIGLHAWIDECEGGGVSAYWSTTEGGGDGPQSLEPSLRLDPTSSSVQFNSPGTNTCQDFNTALKIDRDVFKNQSSGWGTKRGCWRKLVKQMANACNGPQAPPKKPEPPKGYCGPR